MMTAILILTCHFILCVFLAILPELYKIKAKLVFKILIIG